MEPTPRNVKFTISGPFDLTRGVSDDLSGTSVGTERTTRFQWYKSFTFNNQRIDYKSKWRIGNKIHRWQKPTWGHVEHRNTNDTRWPGDLTSRGTWPVRFFSKIVQRLFFFFTSDVIMGTTTDRLPSDSGVKSRPNQWERNSLSDIKEPWR